MSTAAIIPATYAKTDVRRFDGNPFIEALPPLEKTKSEFLTNLSNYPALPTPHTRRASEVARIMEMATVSDLVFPFPEYQKASIALTAIIRESYVARNPLTISDRRRRHALATSGQSGLPFPSDWKSSAKGHFMMAISGMGKTTFAKAFLLRYPQLIEHKSYRGKPLKCSQVVYLFLRIPHDATLRALCIQFFEGIDDLLHTTYVRQAQALRHIAPMVQLMSHVATAVSLGFLVVDEVQNLAKAKGGSADHVLNLFSEIIERLGISLLVLATPAVQAVVEGSVRNARKLASFGETVIGLMRKNDPLWDMFCDAYWAYTYVKKNGSLTPAIRNAWHDVSGGNTAFASLAFMLAQYREIGEREFIDEGAFTRIAANDMAFLQPAIAALRSGNPSDLRAFDDLIFSPKYQALRKLLGAKEPQLERATHAEFDDVRASHDPIAARSRTKRVPKTRAISASDESDVNLPMEDPLVL